MSYVFFLIIALLGIAAAAVWLLDGSRTQLDVNAALTDDAEPLRTTTPADSTSTDSSTHAA